jgi:hypothetical protein
MTNVDPPIPIKNLMAASPPADLTRPIIPVGMAVQKRTIPMGILGPYLSTKGPKTKRMMIVPDTADIDEFQSCSLLKSNDICTSDNRGEMLNHIRNAT